MQERHYLRFPEQSFHDARPRATWLTRIAVAAGTATLALLGTGCPEPADLDNPSGYPKPGDDGTPAGGSTPNGGNPPAGTPNGGNPPAGTPSASCTTACMTQVLSGCTICHGDPLKSAMLDLKGDDYSARLKDKPATHAETDGACPTGDKLIDSGNPMESWFLKKVASQQGSCGTPMPPSTGLAGGDLKCVQDYVSCVAAGGM